MTPPTTDPNGLLEALAAQAVVMDPTGVVVATNRAWREGEVCCFGNQQLLRVGDDLRQTLEGFAGEEFAEAHGLARAIRAVASGEIDSFARRIQCPNLDRWQQITLRRFTDESGSGRLLMTRDDVTAEQQVDRALLDTERRYQAIVEGQTELICRFLPDTTLTFVNKAYCEYFHKTSGQLLGRPFLDLVPPQDRAGIRETLAGFSPDAPTRSYEHRVEMPSGEIAWHAWTDIAFFDEDGRVTEFQSVGRDITHLKKTEAALIESQGRFNQLADHLHEVFWVFDCLSRQMLYLSPAFSKLFNRPPQAVLEDAKQWLESVHPDDRVRVNKAFRAVDTGEPYDLAYRIVWPDGTERWVRDRGHSVEDEAGRVVRIVGLTEDITDHKQAEQEVLRQHEENQIILDAIPALVWYKDTANNFLRVNKAVCKARGIPVQEIEGRHASEVYPDQAEQFFCDDQQVMRSGQAKIGYLQEIAGIDGRSIWIRTDKVPIFDEHRRPNGIIVIATDVTELRQATEKLRRSEERFRSLFDRVPVSIWEQDLSEIGRWMDGLRRDGVEDFTAYYSDHPEAYAVTAKLIKIINVNQTTFQMFGGRDLEEVSQLLSGDRQHAPREPWLCKMQMIWDGRSSAEMETHCHTILGRKFDAFFRFEVPKVDGRLDLSRAITAITDISANRQRLFAQAQVAQADSERKLLAHELHDTLAQQLVGIKMLTVPLRRRIEADPTAAQKVDELAEMLGEANGEVRRLISGLRPERIGRDELEAALGSLATRVALMNQMPVDFHCPRAPHDLDEDSANHLLLIAREAAYNAAKHARARRIRITLDEVDDGVILTVDDDGIGLPPPEQRDAGAGSGLGLGIMRYRAEVIGATITFDALPEGGTTVCCVLPPDRLRHLLATDEGEAPT